MISPPATPVSDTVETVHGREVRDPYRWLEDGDAPAVREWVALQGAHTRSVLDALPERPAIAARIRQALDIGALGGSVPRRRYRFSTWRGTGMDQFVLRVSDQDGRQRVLVDPAPMSGDGTISLDWWTPSPDGELVCFGLSEAGSEDATLHILRTASGEWLPDRIARCRWSAIAFEPGNAAILYSRLPAPGTVPPGEEVFHRHVWRHVIGTDPGRDVRVFGEGQDKLASPVSISISDDGRWTAITVARGWDRTAVHLRERDGEFRAIFDGQAEKLHAWFTGQRLLGLTNVAAPNFRLVEIDPQRPGSEHWRDVIPESEHALVDVAVTADRLAVHHLAKATSRVTLHDLEGGSGTSIELPGPCTVTALGGDRSSPHLHLTVETFTRPAMTVRVTSGSETAMVDRLDPPPGFDPAAHRVRQVWYRSKDGTEVPMFLVGRQAGSGPTVLTGYGGFSISRTPQWLAASMPFVEADGLIALPNLRGGGEFGERWHRAGMLESKQNVFDDFLAAAEWLLAEGLATPRQLGILGGSNGGLLVGAAMTQRPDLFGAVVCRVPLLDMVRYERFKIAELWAAEYGSARDAEQFAWLHAYSPYHRVRDGERYPPTLLTTGEEDARVDPMHARKMTARLQAADPDSPVLLRVEPRAGHGQGKPVNKVVPEEADVWAFLLHTLSGSTRV